MTRQDLATRLAATDLPVLLVGNAGVGKSSLARFIHNVSPRAAQPLLILHALGCTPTGLAATLQSDAGGTLVLEEVARLSSPCQRVLLQWLRNRTDQATPPWRIVSTSRESLEEAVQQRRFSAELSSLLSVLPIVLSPFASHRLTARFAADGETPTLADAAVIDGRGAFARQREQAERVILLCALREGRGARTDVAHRLGTSPRTPRYSLAHLRANAMEVPA